MQVAGVGATAPNVAEKQSGLQSLKSEDFFQILVTELQQQDPFEPTKTSDMVAQVSDIRSIELSQQLSETLGRLADQQQTAGVSDLIGKFVVSAQDTGEGEQNLVAGIVTGVRFASDGSTLLELDTGQSVLASEVDQIIAPELVEAMPEVPTSGEQDKTGDQAKTRQGAAAAEEERTGLHAWLDNLGKLLGI